MHTDTHVLWDVEQRVHPEQGASTFIGFSFKTTSLQTGDSFYNMFNEKTIVIDIVTSKLSVMIIDKNGGDKTQSNVIREGQLIHKGGFFICHSDTCEPTVIQLANDAPSLISSSSLADVSRGDPRRRGGDRHPVAAKTRPPRCRRVGGCT